MFWVKKCRNLSVGDFPYYIEYFPHAEYLELHFLRSLVIKVAFVDKIIRGNVIYNSFY